MRLVGFIGRFSHQKDPLCLLKAVKRTVKECLNVHFLLVGGGELKSEMVDFISQNDLGKIVTVWDFRQDINNILNALDLFVISSIYEGLGRSLTEAMAKGIPVVATAVEGVPEIVQHNVTGRLVPPKNSKELSKMIIRAIENKPQSLYMAVKGKKWVYEKFSVDKMVKDIDNVYQRLISLS
jgi:glycosyltransferase involved in cell wall biosynthesis